MASIVVNGDTSGSVTLSAPATAGTVTVTLPATSGTMLTTASSTGVSGSAISSGTVAEAYGGTGTNTGYYGFKNRIINGAMVIDQRNAGALISAPTSGQYTVDRWWYGSTQTSKMSFQQNAGSVTPPTGFTNYAGLTSSSAYSVSSSDIFFFEQIVEGFNCADLGWGTANAQTVTLSFWVRSSLTGTFGGALANSAHNRSYPFSYTISAANTWEQKSITITGDTSGTWLTNNGVGIQVIFGLGGGSTRSGTAGSWQASTLYTATGATSVVGTNGATFYITGVQLEKGSTATSFDYRPFGTELDLCLRYYEKNYDLNTAIGTSNPSTSSYSRLALSPRLGSTSYGSIPYKVLKRTQPSVSFWSTGGSANLWDCFNSSGSASTLTPTYNDGGQYNLNISIGSSSSYDLIQGFWAASAEL